MNIHDVKVTEEEIDNAEWVSDEYGYLNFLVKGKIWVYIQPRNHY